MKISMVDVSLRHKGNDYATTELLVAAEGSIGSCTDEFVDKCFGIPKNKKIKLSMHKLKQIRKAVRDWCFDSYPVRYDNALDALVDYDDPPKEATTPDDFSPLTCYRQLRAVRNIMDSSEGSWYIRWTYGDVKDDD